MPRQACCYVALSLLVLLPATMSGEEPCESGVRFRPPEVMPITLQFQNTTPPFVFRAISAVTDTPFRVPPDLNYRVSYDIRNVGACHVLEIIGESLSLTYHQDGDTIVVVPPEPLPPQATPPDTPEDH